ncbi:hypothetical protein Tco_0664495 [Tanacetum coccineum]
MLEYTGCHLAIVYVKRESRKEKKMLDVELCISVLPESSTKQPQQEYDPSVEDQQINDDADLFDDTPSKSFDDAHWVPTTTDQKRMELALDQMMRNRCKTGVEYEYHIQQESCGRHPKAPARCLYNEDLYYPKHGNIEEKNVLSLHKIHATSFPKPDLEEKLNIWVGRVFKHLKFEERITEVIKVKNVLTYKQGIIKEIVVRRANGQFSAFSESNYKYSSKNDIEDMYLLCLMNKVEHLHNELSKSLTDDEVWSPPDA